MHNLAVQKKYLEDQLIMSRKDDTSKPLINIDKYIQVQQRIIELIKNSDCFFPKTNEIGWMILLKKLLEKLKIHLLDEIAFENSLITLNYSDWPEKGSVVALLSNKFRTTEFDKDLHFRELNDPHYYKEEISYIEDNVTHLIIN